MSFSNFFYPVDPLGGPLMFTSEMQNDPLILCEFKCVLKQFLSFLFLPFRELTLPIWGLISVTLSDLWTTMFLPFYPMVIMTTIFLLSGNFGLYLRNFVTQRLKGTIFPRVTNNYIYCSGITFILLSMNYFYFNIFLLFRPIPSETNLKVNGRLPLRLLFPIRHLFRLLRLYGTFLRNNVNNEANFIRFLQKEGTMLLVNNGNDYRLL